MTRVRICYPDTEDTVWDSSWEYVQNIVGSKIQHDYPSHYGFHLEFRDNGKDVIRFRDEETWATFIAAFEQFETIKIHVVAEAYKRKYDSSPPHHSIDPATETTEAFSRFGLTDSNSLPPSFTPPPSKQVREIPRRKTRSHYGGRNGRYGDHSDDQVFGTSDSVDSAAMMRRSPRAYRGSDGNNSGLGRGAMGFGGGFDDLYQQSHHQVEQPHQLDEKDNEDHEIDVDDGKEKAEVPEDSNGPAIDINDYESEFVCKTCKKQFNQMIYYNHIRHCKPEEPETKEEKVDPVPDSSPQQSFVPFSSQNFHPPQPMSTSSTMDCKYCEAPFRHEELREHEKVCGTRTDMCDGCGSRVQKKDMESHMCRPPSPGSPPPPMNLPNRSPRIVPPSPDIMFPSSAFLSYDIADDFPTSDPNDAFYGGSMSLPRYVPPDANDFERPLPRPALSRGFDIICSGIGLTAKDDEEQLKIFTMLKKIISDVRSDPLDAQNRTVKRTTFGLIDGFRLFLNKIGFEEQDDGDFYMNDGNYIGRFLDENEKGLEQLDREIKQLEEKFEFERQMARRVYGNEFNQWACGRCGFRNSEHKDFCEKCYSSRFIPLLDDNDENAAPSYGSDPPAYEPPSGNDFAVDNVLSDVDDNTWSCKHCTFKNKLYMTECEICALPMS